jgi:O-antigen ligase
LFVRTSELSIDIASKSIGKAPDMSLMFRYRIWKYAWKVFLQNPLTGVGVGNMRIEDAVRPMKVKPREGIGYTDNHYLNVLVETGVLGAAAWVYLLYILFSTSWRIVKLSNDHQWQIICFGFLGGIIVFLTGGMFWLLTAFVYDSAMLAFLFALVFSSKKLLNAERAFALKMSPMIGYRP